MGEDWRSPDDEMSEDDEEAWCAEQREAVIDYLRRQGVAHGEVAEWPAWHLPPDMSIWAVESLKRPGWVGWWAISGDVPSDYCTAEQPAHPRKAARHFSESWLAALAATPPEAETIGETGLPAELADLLRARAELLADLAADDDMWPD